MFARSKSTWVCYCCFQTRKLTSSTHDLLPPPPPSGVVKLTNRGLILLHGQDVPHFLQGIVTNNVRHGQTHGFYSAFLTATGRVLNDVFIYPAGQSPLYTSQLSSNMRAEDPAYFIEVDANETLTLLKHLKRYKLRSKLAIRAIEHDEWVVWAAWNESEPWTPHPSPSTTSTISNVSSAEDTVGCVDLRAPGLGRRIVLPGHAPAPTSDLPETTLAAYRIRRMLKGVAEGQDEIKRDHSLPQESNMDFMAGIDFRKGCYVGQELTIRTHHIGVVRKRILPVMLYEAGSAQPEKLAYVQQARLQIPPEGTNIVPAEKKGRSAGKWVTGVGNIGLGLCRIEMMTDMVLTGEGSRWKPDDEFKLSWGSDEQGGEHVDGNEKAEVRAKAFVPDWIRSKTKVKNPARQV